MRLLLKDPFLFGEWVLGPNFRVEVRPSAISTGSFLRADAPIQQPRLRSELGLGVLNNISARRRSIVLSSAH